MVIDINEITFNRGEEGQLLTTELKLEGVKGEPTIMARPLTRGKLQEIYAKAISTDDTIRLSADNDIIKFGLEKPELNDKQIEDLKPSYATAITTAILSLSLGIPQVDVGKEARKIIDKEELALKKK